MFVYAMRGGGYLKIGVSDDVQKRLKYFNGGVLPFSLSIVCFAETNTTDAIKIETHLLETLPGRLKGEWLDGATTDDEVIAEFNLFWEWTSPVMTFPTDEQIAAANRESRLNRTLKASRAVAEIIENGPVPPDADWHKIATGLLESGETKTLRKVKKALKTKRLAAQNKHAKKRAA